MNVQPYQLIFLLIYSILLIGIWKIKSGKIKVFLMILGGIIFLFNPIRFKQEGVSKIERSVTKHKKLPEKVIIDETEFEYKQDVEMKKLKQQTEDLKDEIHD